MLSRGASIVITAVTISLFAGTARAGDGALEINAACVATGCFAGDAPGFPVQTAADTHYLLTSSLVLASGSPDGVLLAGGATLDLGGFAITGPYTCNGAPPLCAGSGSGFGVSLADRAAIRNGAVRGMFVGVNLAGRSTTVESVVIEGNGTSGINGNGTGAIIRGCHVSRNGGAGALLSDADGTLFGGNVFLQNGGTGISMSANGASVIGNTFFGNVGVGISMISTNGYGQNVLNGNAGGAGQVSNSPTQVGPNLCGNDTACP